MTPLSIFVSSIIFCNVIMPILDSISTWVQNCFNYKSAELQMISEKMAQENQKTESLIGFQVENESSEVNYEQ